MSVKDLTKQDFEKACSNSLSMAEACSKLGLHFNTFKKHALKYGCYNPNQGMKGGKKKIPKLKFNLEKWNNNELLNISRATLRKWIWKLKLIPFICNKCKSEKWLGEPIPLEINHIDGNNSNHRKNNIELLCPNCHTLTDNYRGRNK